MRVTSSLRVARLDSVVAYMAGVWSTVYLHSFVVYGEKSMHESRKPDPYCAALDVLRSPERGSGHCSVALWIDYVSMHAIADHKRNKSSLMVRVFQALVSAGRSRLVMTAMIGS